MFKSFQPLLLGSDLCRFLCEPSLKCIVRTIWGYQNFFVSFWKKAHPHPKKIIAFHSVKLKNTHDDWANCFKATERSGIISCSSSSSSLLLMSACVWAFRCKSNTQIDFVAIIAAFEYWKSAMDYVNAANGVVYLFDLSVCECLHSGCTQLCGSITNFDLNPKICASNFFVWCSCFIFDDRSLVRCVGSLHLLYFFVLATNRWRTIWE